MPGAIGADSWIAISRPPWFTALALWAIGSTYCAGGHFVDDHSLRLGGLTAAPDQGALPLWLRLTADAPYIDHTPDWPDRTVHINRLLRRRLDAIAIHRRPAGELGAPGAWRSAHALAGAGGGRVVRHVRRPSCR